jgi:hypothetical protein
MCLLAGCAVSETGVSRGLPYWQKLARERHLAGESTALFTYYRRESVMEQRRSGLPDLAGKVAGLPREQAAALSVDTLMECLELTAVRLVPENMTYSDYAMELFGGRQDYRSALLLAEKAMLDSTPWKDAAAYERERELYSELQNRFGQVPAPGAVQLVIPEAEKVSPMPPEIRKHFGNTPDALLKLGAVILSLPGEFARQLLVAPESKVGGIWLEARRSAVLAALSISGREFALAYQRYTLESNAGNLYRCRQWFYRQELLKSALPLVRGSKSDLAAWNAMLQLQSHL